MLDLKFVISNINLVIEKLSKRGNDFSFLKDLLPLNHSRKELISQIEMLRFHKNDLSHNINKIQDNYELKEDLFCKEKISKQKIKELEERLSIIDHKIFDILSFVPNIPHFSVPQGTKNKNNSLEVYSFLEPRIFSFPIKNHLELGKQLDILDFKRASKIVGSKFVVAKGLGARLERSLINFMIDTHIQKGYQEIFPPFIVNESSMYATGQLPKFKKELFRLDLDQKDWYLNPTAEVPIINFHRNEILNINQLPIKYVGFTTCFRQEAGASGSNTRGILRQKQFNKIELIQFVEPYFSYKHLEEMLKDSEDILKKLKLPYKVVVLDANDLGFSMAKTYDIEVFFPGQKCYYEIASISNAESFQAIRSNIKFLDSKKISKKYVHTLNGSALAIGRTLAAIIENYQNDDGSVTIPEVLCSYMGTDIIK
ncbi:serine--tRNA ligase [Candidatus Phytoplasma pini]|uniref:Serine--tRNA ligase n=1 Tax=Candidatus Phytoplasma pini TaxID=267362 RepID=A0A559KK38_9MOLU|nr:serine--tRNA ligase [Candidatus Phytoplasma pini]TVY12468.1 Seryl-tRNA synthetase [Candidatus Phytoplasma pini]